MQKTSMKLMRIWTIGHSTRTLETFIAMLKQFQIELVVDTSRTFEMADRHLRR
jgi:uncharacterized protein (DUF488 family)